MELIICITVILSIMVIYFHSKLNNIADKATLEKVSDCLLKEKIRRREKELLGIPKLKDLPKSTGGKYEKPLDITGPVPINQVIPPPADIQGINQGNQIT